MKSVVLLREIEVLRGAGGRYFVIFLVAGRLFGSFLGDGSNEIGYRRLRSWKMGGRRLEDVSPE